MSKIVRTTSTFLQTDFNGYVQNFKNGTVDHGWAGNDYTNFQVEISGMTLSCEAHQRMRVTPMSVEFNKSVLPVVNLSNQTFFLIDQNATPRTATPIIIPVGNVSCVGENDPFAATAVSNSLVALINKALHQANGAWGLAGGLHVRVHEANFADPANYTGNIEFVNNTLFDIACIRDTNFQEGTLYNSSAHNLMGLLLNEVHFAGATPTNSELGQIYAGTVVSTSLPGDICGRPPVLTPLDHIYVRSRSLLPNGLAPILNGTNIGSGLIQSDIICRIPWNEGVNTTLAGYGGLTNNFTPNILSGYSYDTSQWMWKNQSGKDFSFFAPANVVSNIKIALTTFQGTPINQLGQYQGSSDSFLLNNNGIGAFAVLKFDVLE